MSWNVLEIKLLIKLIYYSIEKKYQGICVWGSSLNRLSIFVLKKFNIRVLQTRKNDQLITTMNLVKFHLIALYNKNNKMNYDNKI